jgi:hypothetical protein
MGRWLKILPALAVLAMVAALLVLGADPMALFLT